MAEIPTTPPPEHPPTGPSSASDAQPEQPRYRFEGTVRQRNVYGDKYTDQVAVAILATDRTEAIQKMRSAFGATYDDFRSFWSHNFHIERVVEESRDSGVTP